jgi:catechol 2,3-dioxygenase-like lactoylglutathione lyase family enzyme
MARVVGIDHLVLRVGDFARSKRFYDAVLGFLGFTLKYEFADTAGWSNGKTLFWIGAADARGRKRRYRIGDIGFHHYAFELARGGEVDGRGAFLEKEESACRRSAGGLPRLRQGLLRGLLPRPRWDEARRHVLSHREEEAGAQDAVMCRARGAAREATPTASPASCSPSPPSRLRDDLASFETRLPALLRMRSFVDGTYGFTSS